VYTYYILLFVYDITFHLVVGDAPAVGDTNTLASHCVPLHYCITAFRSACITAILTLSILLTLSIKHLVVGDAPAVSDSDGGWGNLTISPASACRLVEEVQICISKCYYNGCDSDGRWDNLTISPASAYRLGTEVQIRISKCYYNGCDSDGRWGDLTISPSSACRLVQEGLIRSSASHDSCNTLVISSLVLVNYLEDYFSMWSVRMAQW
jgi:hypothetical protein